MATLVPNPDGCAEFVPNPFKKEKCKNCGHPWSSHEGVISEAQLKNYQAAMKKAEDDRKAKEEAEKAKERASKLAKKKANQAVEDEWFFDGSKNDTAVHLEESDEDDDCGFRMWNAQDLASDPLEQKPRAEGNRQLKVVNLIDFGECDVAEESPRVEPSTSASSVKGGDTPAPPLPGLGGPIAGAPVEPMLPGVAAFRPPAGPSDQDLLNEILDLKQMLADANEEKNIQVAIVRDEVAEKQQLLEDLLRQKAETEVLLKELRVQVETFNQQAAATADKTEVDELRAEVERLKATAAEAAAAAPAPAEATASSATEEAVVKAHATRCAVLDGHVEAERHRAEAEKLREEVEMLKAAAADAAPSAASAATAAQEATNLAKQARAEAERQRAEAERHQAEAEKLRAEVAQLQAAAEQAAAAPEAPAPASAEAEVPAAAASLIAEICKICVQTRSALGTEGGDVPDQAAASGDLEAQLRSLRELSAKGLAAAEHASAQHRDLVKKVHVAEKVAQSPPPATPAPSAALPLPSAMGSVPASPALSAAKSHILRTPGSQGNPAGAVELAQALKEIRLSAEQQLEWIVQRMRTSSPKAELGAQMLGERMGSPKVEAT